MNFMLGLLNSQRKHDFVVVIVAYFSKMAHFLPSFRTSDTSRVVKIFFDSVDKLHGLSKTIVSNRNVKFTSYF